MASIELTDAQMEDLIENADISDIKTGLAGRGYTVIEDDDPFTDFSDYELKEELEERGFKINDESDDPVDDIVSADLVDVIESRADMDIQRIAQSVRCGDTKITGEFEKELFEFMLFIANRIV